MRSLATRHHQQGAVIVTVALVLLFLLGFMGIALDFGRLFIVKTELQTAMDSCALAAAQELDLQSTAIDRATSAGLTAGNLNAVNLQSATWSGKGQLVTAEITFKDPDYHTTADPKLAQYVQCQHVQPAVQMWLMQAMGVFSGNTTDFPIARDVMASAVATRAHGQTTCPIPVAMRPKAGGVAPDYGYTVGEWVTMLTEQRDINDGQIGWMSLVDDLPGSVPVLRDQLDGFCGTKLGNKLEPSDSGSKVALAERWNFRFGLYKKEPDFTDPLNSVKRPDLTGYSYSLLNSNGSNVYADFASRRSSNAACGDTIAECELVGGPPPNGWGFPGYQYITPSNNGANSHGAEGTNRRLVLVPIIDTTDRVIDYACMLMLQPLSIKFGGLQNVPLEYIAKGSSSTSPCSFSGMPGGAAGPLVPALVR